MYNSFKAFIKENSDKKFLLLSHPSPDPDSIGSSIGLSLFLDSINIENELCVPNGVGEDSNISNIIDYLGSPPIVSEPSNVPDITIILDTPNVDRFEFDDFGKLLFIDHHEAQNPTDNSIIDPDATSTSELVFKLINNFEYHSSDIEGINRVFKSLLIGIVGDTSRFRYANSDTFFVVSSIFERSEINLEEIYEVLDGSGKSRSQKLALLKGSKRIEIKEIKEKIVVTSKVGAHESLLCNYLLSMGADVAIVGSEEKEKIYISSRARRGIDIDLSQLMREVSEKFSNEGFNSSGGGHYRAAGMQIKEKNLSEVMNEILSKIKEKSSN